MEHHKMEQYKIAINNLKQEDNTQKDFYSYYVDRGQCYRSQDLVADLEFDKQERLKILF